MNSSLAKKALFSIVTIVLFAGMIFGQNRLVSAAVLSSRSVTIGDSKPSAVTNNKFDFTLTSIAPLGSIEFEYCENNPFIGTACTPPSGFSASGAVLANQTGETGFVIDPSSTANTLIISRTPVASSAIPVSYNFTNIVNPDSVSKTVFVRVASYLSDDASGPRTDEGAVAFSTASAFAIQGYVPPYLTFCVGVTVSVNCTSANGSSLSFGVLKPTETSYLSSEFSGATNDPGGFSTYITGVTMTSGNNVIPALATATSSQLGVSQFGMNLRANSSPIVGSESTGPGTSAAQPPYNSSNLYVYNNNQLITNSALPTDFRKFTASYIVNVSAAQKPGIYSTTLTYIAVAAF